MGQAAALISNSLRWRCGRQSRPAAGQSAKWNVPIEFRGSALVRATHKSEDDRWNRRNGERIRHTLGQIESLGGHNLKLMISSFFRFQIDIL